MKTFICIFSLLLVCPAFAEDEKFKFSNCDGKVVKAIDMTLTPHPIIVSPHSEVNVGAKLELLKDLPADAVFNLRGSKLMKVGAEIVKIPIPCTPYTCNLSLCDFMAKNKEVCAFFERSGRKCVCPIAKGMLELPNSKLPLPYEKIKNFGKILDGVFELEAHVTNPAKDQMYACINLHVQVKFQDHDL